ncbi:hypothetical protein DdX_11795 [Ditylenchus destructor]|uniref:Saposin B-type domain-containing protein n=1 Tax=Ditylenchus destructor TaxID=166010 RepID=A0AAD4R0V0_9BILA|nr:hypothetical protein DdX_11795 [Ditylenchus destructor]
MTHSVVKMSIVVFAFMDLSSCSAKSVGLSNLASLAQVSTQSNETDICQFCNHFVEVLDESGPKPEYNTSEKMAKGLEDICEPYPEDVLCKALKGKYDVFAKAYFQHRDDPEVVPCKVAGVCQAKSVGFKNLAKLSQVFDSPAYICGYCEEYVKDFDELGSDEIISMYNTSEGMAQGIYEPCHCGKCGSPIHSFCDALEGKFDVFAKAYFQHMDNHENRPLQGGWSLPAQIRWIQELG